MALFYAVSALYNFSVSSLGLAVYARSLPQAAMMLFLILFPMLFLSGATLVLPMRYYIDFGYQVLFKGNGLAYVWHDILGIVALGSLMFGFAAWRYRRLV